MTKIRSALTIAGTDPTGGAGIQADLKTFQELKSYGMSIITSIVAQNTMGVQGTHHLPLSIIERQFDSILEDVSVHAFKTGMIANIEMMEIIKQKIPSLQAPYVMDPVMVTTSGDVLIEEEARLYLRNELLPLTTVITPNIPEAEHLLGRKIKSLEDMQNAAKEIVLEYGTKAALVKGGHLEGDATDFLFDGEEMHTFSVKRVNTKHTHGTGCTLSAAITAYLSQGDSLVRAVEKAKEYVTLAIQHSIDIGQGSGPTNHFAPRIEVDEQ